LQLEWLSHAKEEELAIRPTLADETFERPSTWPKPSILVRSPPVM
jgi:hypothetical protein